MTEQSATARPTGRPRLTRHDVVLAACALLDEEGDSGLSMARVGQRLGVTAMALYRHVTDREDLEGAVVDHVLADLFAEEDSSARWEAVLWKWMHQVHSHWLCHPWIGRLIGGHTLSPSWIAALARLAGVLYRAGLTDEQVAREIVQISRVVVGVTMLEVQSPLPQTGAFHRDALARLSPNELSAWKPLEAELDRYTNQALFDDLVVQTIDRIRSTTTTQMRPLEAGQSVTKRKPSTGA